MVPGDLGLIEVCILFLHGKEYGKSDRDIATFSLDKLAGATRPPLSIQQGWVNIVNLIFDAPRGVEFIQNRTTPRTQAWQLTRNIFEHWVPLTTDSNYWVAKAGLSSFEHASVNIQSADELVMVQDEIKRRLGELLVVVSLLGQVLHAEESGFPGLVPVQGLHILTGAGIELREERLVVSTDGTEGQGRAVCEATGHGFLSFLLMCHGEGGRRHGQEPAWLLPQWC